MTNHQNKCFISLAIKALEIKRKFKLYTSEKEYAKAENENAEINKCLCTELSESFNTVLNAQKNVKSTSFFNKFLVEDSVENFILKSVFGFLGGIFLTYICFMFLVFSLNFTLKRATYICMGLGVILSLGLAFSIKIRCTVFLCIPQLFSKRGRQALLAYAFILALSGPAKNTLHNVEVMSESLACTQEQLKQAENELVKCVQKPNAAARKSIEKLLEKITYAVKDFKNFILQLYKTCFDILETVLHGQKWLYSITLLCHKKMGRPSHRCLKLLADSKENCEDAVMPLTPWKQLCHIRPGGEKIICSAKANSVCMRSDIQESLPVLELQKQLENFKHRAMNIFFVSLEAHQTYSQTNRTFTYHEEYQGMATEIRQKTDQFLQYFDFMSVIFGIFILVLFVKVIIYRHKFLTKDHYDNRYITADFVDIDNTRAAFHMDTLLPLAPREKMQYIKVSSVRLVPCERIRLFSSFVFLIFATFKIIIHMLTDSSLYWILSTVRRDERLLYMSSLREEESSITLRVVGDGLVAALIQNVSRAVKRESSLTRLDPTPCLPDPVPPDWNRYYQIIALVIICWLLALCEPYGLRLRHTVMVTYHPDRARERAIWLYNKIISNRISFVKISRRELRRKYKNVSLEDTFRYKFMRKTSSPKCLLCKTKFNNINNWVKCSTVKCMGLYCASCFECLKICSICSDPAEYGDLSDLSEEKDSSEEENLCKSPRKKAGMQKMIRNKLNKKQGLLLKIKKTNIKLKEGAKDQKPDPNTLEELSQPTFLIRALQYCRSKIPAFRPLKGLSDVESSDWDQDSTLITEGSSVENKSSDSNRKIEEKNSECEKKSKASFRKTRKKKKGKEGKDSGSDKYDKSERLVPKVCLFKKISPTGSASGSSTEENGSQKSRLSLKEHKESAIDYNRPDFTIERLLTSKDSIEIIKKKLAQKYETDAPEGFGKRDSGALINEGIEESSLKREEAQMKFQTIGSDTQTYSHPLELDVEYSEQRSPEIFPFIDPINVHEFDPGDLFEDKTDLKKKAFEFKCKGELEEKKEKNVSYVVQGAIPMFPYSLSHTRMCFQASDSSDSITDSIRICLREDTGTSSTESDGQFYSQPYRPTKTKLQPERTNSEIKRASAKLNLNVNTHKFSGLYSIETDSSNENFLSVKPSRRALCIHELKKPAPGELKPAELEVEKDETEEESIRDHWRAGQLLSSIIRFYISHINWKFQ